MSNRVKAEEKIRAGDYDSIVYREDNPTVRMHDTWNDINIINSQANERLGYPTQKPLVLLTRIIFGSSNEGDVVFDPFCGCGTTIEAAHNLNRNWIGCDVAFHAINRVSKIRLRDRCFLEEGKDYEITGLPFDEATAFEMWKSDPYHFQKWAVEYIDGFAPARRSGDGGIDGRIYFEVAQEDSKNTLKNMALQVKGGDSVQPDNLRALHGAVALDNNAMLGGFIVRKHISGQQRKNFEKIMGDAGVIDINGKTYPKLQMLTIREILEGKRFYMPYTLGHRSSPQLEFTDVNPNP